MNDDFVRRASILRETTMEYKRHEEEEKKTRERERIYTENGNQKEKEQKKHTKVTFMFIYMIRCDRTAVRPVLVWAALSRTMYSYICV